MSNLASHDIFSIQTKAPGPAGNLPLSAEEMRSKPSGDIFGMTQSAGMGWKNPDEENDASNIEDETTWSIGVVWSDFGNEGNDLGIAYGTAEGHRDDSGYDDPMAYEVYYSIAVSDNVTVTPAYFNIEKDGADDVSGALVKTTFRF